MESQLFAQQVTKQQHRIIYRLTKLPCLFAIYMKFLVPSLTLVPGSSSPLVTWPHFSKRCMLTITNRLLNETGVVKQFENKSTILSSTGHLLSFVQVYTLFSEPPLSEPTPITCITRGTFLVFP